MALWNVYVIYPGQEQVDGCTETCLKYVGGVEDFNAFSQELLWTLYVYFSMICHYVTRTNNAVFKC